MDNASLSEVLKDLSVVKLSVVVMSVAVSPDIIVQSGGISWDPEKKENT